MKLKTFLQNACDSMARQLQNLAALEPASEAVTLDAIRGAEGMACPARTASPYLDERNPVNGN
jgi:hypothetical protein